MTKTFSDYGIQISPGSGPEVYTQCPKCSNQRKKKNAKCLSVNVDKGVWKCWHCGWVGGLNAPSWFDTDKVKTWMRPAPKVKLVDPERGGTFLVDRGISIEAIYRNKIEFGKVYFPQIEDEADAIIFPYFRDGELVNRKYRSVEGKYFRLETGCERVLYGLDDINPDLPLFWCEGEVDKISIEVAGFVNAVSVPNGAPSETAKNYESLFSFLDSASEKIGAIRRHIIAVDSDKPGQRLEDELSRRLGVEKCFRVRWPDGCKDANDVLLKYGADDLRYYLENPDPFPIEGAYTASDTTADLMRLYQQGYERGYETGWNPLNEYYTVRPGEVTIVSGIPSSGKSNFLDAMFVNLAEMYDWRFAMFSPENLPLERHVASLLEKRVRFPFYQGFNMRMSEEDVGIGRDWLNDKFYWILPSNDEDWTLDKILNIAGQLCLRYGIRGLTIDPWNELESSRPAKLSETEYISQSLKRVKVFARQRKVHVWIVVHPSKLYRDNQGKYPVPTLYDCAGSAHWRNKADNGIIIYRDLTSADTTAVEVHVQKVRFRDIGKRGTATLYYQHLCARYEEKPGYIRDDSRTME